ncbi:MAG: sensor domain-containing diguanylate cyclase [Ilumatobacteraceae bacterium]|nr:sensor domain-containing diguanylate cyclase [Ilumatobacteraceae bacterium]
MTTLTGEMTDMGAFAMLDALPERVIRYHLSDLVVVYCNAVWAASYNLEPAQVVGRSLDQFLNEDGLAGLKSQLALLGPDNPVVLDCVARSDFSVPGVWVEWVDRYVSGPDGAEILAVGRDVTRRHIAESNLAESEARFRHLADNSADVVWHFASEPFPHFVYLSPSVEAILGYSPSYFLGDFTRMLEILDDVGRLAIARAIAGEQVLERFDFRFRHANGSIVVGETQTTILPGGLQGVSRDVTELRHLQANIADLALHDPLTGLANRRLFYELFSAELGRKERNGQPLAIAFLDLDGFKGVNDTYGHDVGDLVLCETARRLLSTVRRADCVARLGGDEFVIVFEPNGADSNDLISRIDRILSTPIEITPTAAVYCPASIGIADTRTVGHDADELLAAADDAMYEVKRARYAVRDAPHENVQSDVVSGVHHCRR